MTTGLTLLVLRFGFEKKECGLLDVRGSAFGCGRIHQGIERCLQRFQMPPPFALPPVEEGSASAVGFLQKFRVQAPGEDRKVLCRSSGRISSHRNDIAADRSAGEMNIRIVKGQEFGFQVRLSALDA